MKALQALSTSRLTAAVATPAAARTRPAPAVSEEEEPAERLTPTWIPARWHDRLMLAGLAGGVVLGGLIGWFFMK